MNRLWLTLGVGEGDRRGRVPSPRPLRLAMQSYGATWVWNCAPAGNELGLL